MREVSGRLELESAKAFAAFSVYLSLDEDRLLEAMAMVTEGK
jgi:hypothetical protein